MRAAATYRSTAVAFLAAAVAVRISPGDGWSEVGWRVVVAVVAAVGAVRLARRCPIDPEDTAWSPWIAGILFGCSPILMAGTLRTPFDALVYATLPWLAAPMTRASTGWRRAASALWLAFAGLGSAPWAVAAVLVGVLAALPRNRSDVGGSLRWLVLAAAASSWWVVAWLVGTDADATSSRDLAEGLARTAGSADLAPGWSALLLGAPVLTAAGFLLWRMPGRHRPVVFVLVLAAAGSIGWFLGVDVPSSLPVGGVEVPDALAAHGVPESADVLAAGLALAGVGGLLSWVPLMAHLVPRARTRHLVASVMVVVIGVTSAAGVAYAAHERVPGSRFDQEMAGASTQA